MEDSDPKFGVKVEIITSDLFVFSQDLKKFQPFLHYFYK